jgi:hypothetical protein
MIATQRLLTTKLDSRISCFMSSTADVLWNSSSTYLYCRENKRAAAEPGDIASCETLGLCTATTLARTVHAQKRRIPDLQKPELQHPPRPFLWEPHGAKDRSVNAFRTHSTGPSGSVATGLTKQSCSNKSGGRRAIGRVRLDGENVCTALDASSHVPAP